MEKKQPQRQPFPSPTLALWSVGELVDLRDMMGTSFQVTGILGEGGMGTIYRIAIPTPGWDLSLAMKCPKAEIFTRPAGKENFMREAETWVMLHGVETITQHTIGDDPGCWHWYEARMDYNHQDLHSNLYDSVAAYDNALEWGWRLSEIFEPNSTIHVAHFHEMVSGYWLGREEAWLVRKPVLLERDERGLFHSAKGKCFEYRDGWEAYGWHGMHVPEWVIMKRAEDLTIYDWLEEENLEVRRVLQERIGAERFLSLMGAVCIDRGERGSL